MGDPFLKAFDDTKSKAKQAVYKNRLEYSRDIAEAFLKNMMSVYSEKPSLVYLQAKNGPSAAVYGDAAGDAKFVRKILERETQARQLPEGQEGVRALLIDDLMKGYAYCMKDLEDKNIPVHMYQTLMSWRDGKKSTLPKAKKELLLAVGEARKLDGIRLPVFFALGYAEMKAKEELKNPKRISGRVHYLNKLTPYMNGVISPWGNVMKSFGDLPKAQQEEARALSGHYAPSMTSEWFNKMAEFTKYHQDSFQAHIDRVQAIKTDKKSNKNSNKKKRRADKRNPK